MINNNFYSINGIVIKLFPRDYIKRINIRIKPLEGVVVSYPSYISFERVEDFINLKFTWIKKQYIKIKKIEERITLFDMNTNFNTKSHKLCLQRVQSNKIKYLIGNQTIDVLIPEQFDIFHMNVQNSIRFAIEETWRLEAKDYLPKRVEELADEHNLIYNKVFIKKTKSIWGSCSFVNNINLSLYLMRLKENLIDYVILHELAHTRIKNHSKYFWSFLDDLVKGDAKILDKEIKSFRIDIY